MPILHRLACFRDDVVFLIFLYQVFSLRLGACIYMLTTCQRWIYRIDPNRVNEYGQVMEIESSAAEGQQKDKAVVVAESKKTR
jgi:hypothetical protein